VTTFDRFTEQAKRWVRREQRTFSQPDDDWDMSIGIDFPGEERHYFFRVPSPLANSEEGKDALAHALGMAVHQFKPTKLAIISSTWMVELKGDPPEKDDMLAGRLRPSQHPDRIEAVVLLVADQEITHVWRAKIIRSDDGPPDLEPWELQPVAAELSGRMIDPWRYLLR
jgi:hypothetical protein